MSIIKVFVLFVLFFCMFCLHVHVVFSIHTQVCGHLMINNYDTLIHVITRLQMLRLVFVSIKYNRQDWITEFGYYGNSLTIH